MLVMGVPIRIGCARNFLRDIPNYPGPHVSDLCTNMQGTATFETATRLTLLLLLGSAGVKDAKPWRGP